MPTPEELCASVSGLVPETQLPRLTEKADIPLDEAIFGQERQHKPGILGAVRHIRRKVISHSTIKARRLMNSWDVTFTA
jgi:hypothetical protein